MRLSFDSFLLVGVFSSFGIGLNFAIELGTILEQDGTATLGCKGSATGFLPLSSIF